ADAAGVFSSRPFFLVFGSFSEAFSAIAPACAHRMRRSAKCAAGRAAFQPGRTRVHARSNRTCSRPDGDTSLTEAPAPDLDGFPCADYSMNYHRARAATPVGRL